MTDKLRQAIEQAVAILGPEAPLCSGCVAEWTEALRILNDALAEPTVTVRYDLGAAETDEAIRQRLIELGWTPPKAEPQEPVAWALVASNTGNVCGVTLDEDDFEGMRPERVLPLYTAPHTAKCVPLKAEALRQMWAAYAPIVGGVLEFARAIERDHGITGETK